MNFLNRFFGKKKTNLSSEDRRKANALIAHIKLAENSATGKKFKENV